jgi:hypothetical protein
MDLKALKAMSCLRSGVREHRQMNPSGSNQIKPDQTKSNHHPHPNEEGRMHNEETSARSNLVKDSPSQSWIVVDSRGKK